ncbi:hypothetical protein ANN_19399 [Periplaneta americana]|uniref:SAP domain-containing protein n=1 Tax=Periplaneta americana TaxID=6978 RepID=A0ABQ8SA53_PERAM|nr:hypothetical protein ANN_19399 [Periplaneta americana]
MEIEDDSAVPNPLSVREIVKKLRETGFLADKKSQLLSKVLTEESLDNSGARLENVPENLSCLVQEIGVSMPHVTPHPLTQWGPPTALSSYRQGDQAAQDPLQGVEAPLEVFLRNESLERYCGRLGTQERLRSGRPLPQADEDMRLDLNIVDQQSDYPMGHHGSPVHGLVYGDNEKDSLGIHFWASRGSTTLEVEFGTEPPTRLTITRIRDKFEVDETVQDVLKMRCGRKRSSADNESVYAVMQAFAQSPNKSMRILQAQKWKPYIPRLVHTLNEDDPEMDRTKRKCCGVPASISRLNPSRLLSMESSKGHSVRHKTTNTGGTESSD